MAKILTQTFIVTLTGLMMTVYVVTLGMEMQEAILSLLAVFLILFAVVLERFIPYRTDWNESRGDLSGDVTSMIFIVGILDSVLKSATPFLLLIVLADWAQGTINLPLGVEIIAAGLLIELGAYISHRLHHKLTWLWSLHAMHHSPERLYTLNNFRFHPLNYILNHLLTMVPVVLLGFSVEAILGYTALTLPLLLMQHSNIKFRFGWMNYILNTNEVHRWHHSAASTEGECNFGRALVIWDQLFGTFRFPVENETPAKIGLYKYSRKIYPAANHLWRQLAYPFSSQCCR